MRAQSHLTLCNPMESRLLCAWNFPGKNTEMGCQFLLQGLFPTQGLNPSLPQPPHCRQLHYNRATWDEYFLRIRMSHMVWGAELNYKTCSLSIWNPHSWGQGQSLMIPLSPIPQPGTHGRHTAEAQYTNLWVNGVSGFKWPKRSRLETKTNSLKERISLSCRKQRETEGDDHVVRSCMIQILSTKGPISSS